MAEFTLEPTDEERKAVLLRCLEFLEYIEREHDRYQDGRIPAATIDFCGVGRLVDEVKAALFDPNQPAALLTADEIERATGRETWMCVDCEWLGEYKELIQAGPRELCPECEGEVLQVDREF